MVAPQDEQSRIEGRVSDRMVKKDYYSPRLEQAGTLGELTKGNNAKGPTDLSLASIA